MLYSCWQCVYCMRVSQANSQNNLWVHRTSSNYCKVSVPNVQNLLHAYTARHSMAPSYTNLFIAKLEEKLMASTSTRPKVWWRYTGDILAIWEHGQESLVTFLQQINLFHPTIKFTADTSTERVTSQTPSLVERLVVWDSDYHKLKYDKEAC